MRPFLKYLAVLCGVLVVALAAALGYFVWRYPNVPPPATVSLPTSAESLSRGKYLVEHVTICVDCHSERDWSRFAGPVKAGTHGKGGERFDRANSGIPGTLYAPNITPAGIGEWSDGELMRAVTTGVSRHGRALFPLMPYVNYGQLAEDDVLAVLAYVRTLNRIDHQVPVGSLDFPMNLIVRSIPRAASFAGRPLPEDRVAYGKYLATAASCADCHTPMDNQGQRLPGMDFAGGLEFRHPELGHRVRSANITPEADSGIAQWTEEQFVTKFKGLAAPDDRLLSAEEQRQNSVMPWKQYAGMTTEDLGAIYAYLRSQKPVLNRVDKFPDARIEQ